MTLLVDIGAVFLTTFALAFLSPILWIVLILVYSQYRRQAATEKRLYGRVLNPVGRQVLLSFTLGAMGGFAASAVLVFLGLSIEQIGLIFIWPVALLLLLFNPRYLCFSYAGGIVALVVLLSRHLFVPLAPGLGGSPIVEALLRIHIPALLVLIGLLHLVEALFIYVGGHWGSSPVYVKGRDGLVTGAFLLQKFWPLPLVTLMVAVVPQVEITGVTMPGWWPVLSPTTALAAGESLQYMAVPVAAGLGYTDMVTGSTPRQRCRYSGRSLALYSIIVFVLALGAEYYPWLVWPGVIIAPLGHELLIIYSRNRERKQALLYKHEGPGVCLMSVLPRSLAEEAGLQEGDIIQEVNGAVPSDGEELLELIENSYFMVLLRIRRQEEDLSLVLKKRSLPEEEKETSFIKHFRAASGYQVLHRSVSLGFIPVPAPDSRIYLEIARSDPRARLTKIKKRLRSWLPLQHNRE